MAAVTARDHPKEALMSRLPALLIPALLAGLAGCDRDALYNDRSVSDAIYESYASCSESEIRWLTGKHNIQTVFDKCGSNNFGGFAWSPDGIHLYFQLPFTGHIINGEAKTITGLPFENPIGQVAWLDKDRVVLPLGPEEGGEVNRIVVYDRARNTVITKPLDLPRPDDLQHAGDGRTVYVVSTAEGGARKVHRVDPAQGTVEDAFPWRTESFDTFTYAAGMVAFGVEDQVTIYKAETGEEVMRFEDATRGIIHPEGRYIALETLGDPITPYDQTTWDEMTPEARERERRRTEEWLSRQPDWVPKEVRPPTIDIYDTQASARYRATAFYGDHFEWYPDYNYYCSFLLWGVEGKELNKNVALTNIAERLRMLDKGQTTLGFKRLGVPEEASPEAAGEVEGAAEAEPAEEPPAE